MEPRSTPDEEPVPNPTDVGALLQGYRPRLLRMLAFRLDPRVRRRVDPADVLQESFAEIVRRLEEYRASPAMPFFLWVRFITLQKAVEIQRRHVKAARRDVGREVSPGALPVSSISLAAALVDTGPTPSQEVSRAEAIERVRIALERLEALDREVITLRFFERLSVEETGLALGLSESGIAKRLVRALGRLKRVLPRVEDLPTPA